ncbi:MAG: ATP-dependent DNA helicase RecG [Pyrinomonadaceae bacterium]|nr:ATP-dependent DNA helicase RecG [Pyrinomonadaceae bacterium]
MSRLKITTPLIELHKFDVAHLSEAMSKKLATAAAGFANRTDINSATVEDLLYYFPMRYEDRSNLIGVGDLFDGLEASVEIHTRVSGGFRVGKNRARSAPPLYIFEVTGSDPGYSQKPVVVWWFLSGKQAQHIISYWQKKFSRGTRFIAYGKWEWDSRRNTYSLKISKPDDELEILPVIEEQNGSDLIGELLEQPKPDLPAREKNAGDDEESAEFPLIHTARRVPVYRKFGQFQTKRLREIIFSIFEKLDRSSIAESLPPELCRRHNLISRADAIEQIHFPPENSNLTEYAAARSDAHRRLIFEEFFKLSFALLLKRGDRETEPKGALIEISDKTIERIKSIVPFSLTNAQKRVIKAIFDDMSSESPMNRMIQGDVGSGKTIVAFIAMFAAMENGYQTSLMAPTEILAEQHFRNAKTFFENSGYRAELLVGSLRAAEKRKVHESIRSGEVHAVIGTHAVIQDAVEFENLGLAVIDEQHRFGVLQRGQIREQGLNPDILVMTATPIPRSLAMTLYGDLDISVIDELPPGRTPIKTVVVGEDRRAGVYKGIEREVNLGRQVYIVYPLIEESEKMDLKAATKMFEELRDKTFPNLKVGLLHGKMKSAEKESTMQDFVSGELNILVSTTVIEVGVDVPNASLMIIEHAERFGLSQLHQLRGRVGRGAEQSFCVLLTGDKKTAVARERLGIMEETSDGFKIAEKDLEIRGQGEIFGTRQAGIQTFKIGNIVRDLDILQTARSEAEKYLGPKRLTAETADLIERARKDSSFKLAGIG